MEWSFASPVSSNTSIVPGPQADGPGGYGDTGGRRNPPIVIEWKFATGGLTTNHRLQVARYAHALNQNSNEVHKCLLGNLHTGEIQEVCFEFVPCDDLFSACFAEEEADGSRKPT